MDADSRENAGMREWLVASGIVEGPDGLLLVQNRRRDGSLDWSPPGGVIEVGEGESVLAGLTREVEEETGIVVSAWEGPVWEVEAEAQDMGWHLRVEVHRAVAFAGEVRVEDPDGIVVDARFVPPNDCRATLSATWLPTHEPLVAWLAERWTEARAYRYRVDGAGRGAMTVVRL
jgi:8-oxo-dGTP diphosphatase